MLVAAVLMTFEMAMGCSKDSGPAVSAPSSHPSAEAYCPEGVASGGERPGCVAVDPADSAPRAPVVAPEKAKWEASLGSPAAIRQQLRKRIAGWPSRVLVDPKTLPDEPRRFLRRVAVDTWRGLAAMVDAEHALPIDHIHFRGPELDGPNLEIGDYTSSSNLGLYLLSIVAARELELISSEDALQRARSLIDTMRQLETHSGFLFNYYDTTTLERTSNFVSFIDSAWSSAGLIVARAAFPELAAVVGEILKQRNYAFFYDEGLRRMNHGFDVAAGKSSAYHYGVFFTEARLASLIAIAKGDVPVAHWSAMDRHLAPACGVTGVWRDCVVDRDTAAGTPMLSRWHGISYLPSWGGSMFEALMPLLVVDEVSLAPKGLGANDVAHAAIQRRYALEQLTLPVWGMSPSMDPSSGGYGEFGVGLLGARGYAERVVTPHATALALAVIPDDAIANLRRLISTYPIYGDFGFYDSVDPRSGEVAYSYLTLDQTMLLIAIANHLTDHAIQHLFESDPMITPALDLIRNETFFE